MFPVIFYRVVHKITLTPLLFMEDIYTNRLYGILCFVYYLDNVLDAFNIYNYMYYYYLNFQNG